MHFHLFNKIAFIFLSVIDHGRENNVEKLMLWPLVKLTTFILFPIKVILISKSEKERHWKLSSGIMKVNYQALVFFIRAFSLHDGWISTKRSPSSIDNFIQNDDIKITWLQKIDDDYFNTLPLRTSWNTMAIIIRLPLFSPALLKVVFGNF